MMCISYFIWQFEKGMEQVKRWGSIYANWLWNRHWAAYHLISLDPGSHKNFSSVGNTTRMYLLQEDPCEINFPCDFQTLACRMSVGSYFKTFYEWACIGA